jgi:tRNA A37 threonylcarbamoyladenosine biosynthesis protein TsaE
MYHLAIYTYQTRTAILDFEIEYIVEDLSSCFVVGRPQRLQNISRDRSALEIALERKLEKELLDFEDHILSWTTKPMSETLIS